MPHFHGGELDGRVVVDGLDTRDHRPGELARHAGLVFQDPEAQLVAQRVRHEVAFGLESIGHPPATIAARAQEALMAAGASHLTGRDTGTLSGGEGQRIAIASVLAMGQPLLLLDEPTSQLDPVAAEELLALVVRINRDRGVTVVLAEHRTGRLFSEADRVVVMDAGRIAFDGTAAPPRRLGRRLALAAAAGHPGVRRRRPRGAAADRARRPPPADARLPPGARRDQAPPPVVRVEKAHLRGDDRGAARGHRRVRRGHVTVCWARTARASRRSRWPPRGCSTPIAGASREPPGPATSARIRPTICSARRSRTSRLRRSSEAASPAPNARPARPPS